MFGAASIGDQTKYMKDFSLMSVSLFGVIIAIVLGVNLLHQELGRKTIFNILSKPVARWQFIVGKFFGLLATLSLIVARHVGRRGRHASRSSAAGSTGAWWSRRSRRCSRSWW